MISSPFFRAGLCIAAGVLSTSAFSADPPARANAAVPHVSHHVCDHCGTVVGVKTETRKGKASGLGAVGGAVAGGVIGNQMGGGSGKTLTTVGGAAAGGLLGHEIEKRAKKHTVWITTVKLKDGGHKTFESESNPNLKIGEVVNVDNGQMRKLAAR